MIIGFHEGFYMVLQCLLVSWCLEVTPVLNTEANLRTKKLSKNPRPNVCLQTPRFCTSERSFSWRRSSRGPEFHTPRTARWSGIGCSMVSGTGRLPRKMHENDLQTPENMGFFSMKDVGPKYVNWCRFKPWNLWTPQQKSMFQDNIYVSFGSECFKFSSNVSPPVKGEHKLSWSLEINGLVGGKSYDKMLWCDGWSNSTISSLGISFDRPCEFDYGTGHAKWFQWCRFGQGPWGVFGDVVSDGQCLGS